MNSYLCHTCRCNFTVEYFGWINKKEPKDGIGVTSQCPRCGSKNIRPCVQTENF
jgi:hypothetical protein